MGQAWSAIDNVEQKYKSEKLITAIKNAREQHEYSDAFKLEEVLESMYKPSGNVYTRFNNSEVVEIAMYVSGTLLLLLIPACLNYIRHGSFRLWNKSA